MENELGPQLKTKLCETQALARAILTAYVVWIHYRLHSINYGVNLLRGSGSATKVDAFPEIPESL